MSKFIIRGGKALSGEIRVSGSKNAVLPLICACLLTDKECVISNVPRIIDVDVMVDLMSALGVLIKYDKEKSILSIKAETVNVEALPSELAGKLRASILLIGPLLARVGRAIMHTSGGDRIGVRSIEPHLSAFKRLGAEVNYDSHYSITTGRKLEGAKIVLEETSVTATENVMMAAVLAEGTTTIKLAAMEPHVVQLGEFLKLMGAKIAGLGTPTIVIEGVQSLNGASVRVIPDSNQAATFATLAAATKSSVSILGANPDFMDDFLLKMGQFNVNYSTGTDYIKILPPEGKYRGIKKLQVGLYPKLASDDVPPMAVLATQAEGETVIYEWLYENRLGYAPELNRLGANAMILDPHRVRIIGPTKLSGDKLVCSDIRMGMTLIIAALVASFESEVMNIHHIDRGYESIEKCLSAVGADITRVAEEQKAKQPDISVAAI
jgi:UDP-N-acetylglucosamine 1-carboxyvinyltransferase